MDAHAHLLSLGWAGPGHALDSKPYKQKGHRGLAYDPSQASSNTGNGLVKPLLVSQRKGRLGIGKKSHEPPAGNEWWLKGFESALGNIGKSESERSSGASTPVPYPNLNGRKHSGLYSFFIKGQEMAGTIGENGEIIGGPGRKRKSNLLDGAGDQDGEDGDGDAHHTISSGSNSKRLKATPAAEFKLVSEYIALRDKDERRPKRAERPSPVGGEYIQARSEKEKEKKKRKRQSEEEESEAANTPLTLTADDEGPVIPETKEERRERRRRRREQKDNSRAEESKNGISTPQSIEKVGEEDQDQAAKAARKAERRKRKAEQAAKSVK